MYVSLAPRSSVQCTVKVMGYSLLINIHENITFLFLVLDPGMHVFNFTAKKAVTAVLVGWAEQAI